MKIINFAEIITNRHEFTHIMTRFSLLLASLAVCSGAIASTPTAYIVADAHLDTQWNWDVQTTIREYIPKTLNRNLFLLSHYPDYVFNFEGGVIYHWMKEYYPNEYQMIKPYIRNGRWHISGASWDANDVIVPSVESQIRNIMLGQNLYRNEFGVESTDIFLPDCFGFGWTLPTIANHCGLIGFSSQKLGWRVHPFYGKERYPFTIGLWQGVDSARIMMTHGYGYGHRWNDVDLSNDSTLIAYAGLSPLNTTFRYYGTGDTGGSPTIGSVESVEKGVNGNGPLKVISATSDQLFKDYLPYDAHPELPVFNGELLMDVHGTGCYTSQAAMKLYNRQNEQLGDAAERAAVLASLYAGAEYPVNDFTEGWRRFIWHQFHDDLTGTSIPRAYEFSWNDELLTLKQFSDLLTNSVSNLAADLNTNVKGTPVIFYNPLGYDVTSLTEITIPAKTRPAKATVRGPKGKEVRAQVTGFDGKNARLLVEATVPAVGVAVYDVVLAGKGKVPAEKDAEAIENSLYRLSFNNNGDITSLIDKASGRELVKPGEAIRLALFQENKSYNWPAWEILKTTVDAEPVSITDNVEFKLVENGPLRKRMKITKTYGDSRFTQYVNLYEGAQAPRIDFDNEIDWATTNALVKAEFPLNISNEKATYDLGIGVAERGNNTDTAYEVPAQHWANLSDLSGSNGLTVLTDSKYGWDKPNDNTLRLTLLHTPQTAGGYKYQNRQDFGHHEFTYSLLPHNGSLDRAHTARQGEILNQRLKGFIADKHKGSARELSLARTDVDNVIIKALKSAEDGKAYVVRVYETAGKPTVANILFSRPVASAQLADGTEKALSDIAPLNGNIPVTLPANGIATLRVTFADKTDARQIQTVPLDLPYNKKAFTWNEFRHNGDFAGGYTYAAELIPDTLVYGNIPFILNPCKEYNALAANGETLEIPAGNWQKLHILAAAATEDRDIDATFTVNGQQSDMIIPSYTGFVGQWGHDGHTNGFLRPQKVAYVGTHRHSGAGDEPYEYTYMYHYVIDLPKGATAVTLPGGGDVAIFAATLSSGEPAAVAPATQLFRTAIKTADGNDAKSAEVLNNILTPDMVIGASGFVNDSERPQLIADGDEFTKWCDVTGVPSTIDFDLGKETEIKGWRMVNAAEEDPSYVTAGAFLMGRNDPSEEWQTLDYIAGNSRNVVKRMLMNAPSVRYVRLMITQPTQSTQAKETRIYELQLLN